MKKLLFIVIAVAMLCGCAILEKADMFFDDDCLWRGTVVTVDHQADQTTVVFDGGYIANCDPAPWVRQDDWIEARRTESGCMFSD